MTMHVSRMGTQVAAIVPLSLAVRGPFGTIIAKDLDRHLILLGGGGGVRVMLVA